MQAVPSNTSSNTSNPAQSQMNNLPWEIHCEIISNLASVSDLRALSEVSEYFKSLIDLPQTWKSMIQKTWDISLPSRTDPLLDWRQHWREKKQLQGTFKWTEIKSDVHPTPRQSHTVTKVKDNIYIFGGHQLKGDDIDRQNDMWVFDTKTEQYRQIESQGQSLPPLSRHRCIGEGKYIYSFGGILQDKTKLDSLWRYNSEKNVWKQMPARGAVPAARCDPVMCAYKHLIIVYGGSLSDLAFPSDVHIYDTIKKEWTRPTLTTASPSSRIGTAGVVIGSKLYIYGGGNWCTTTKKYIQLFNEVWSLDLEKWTWTLEKSTGEVPSASDFLNIFPLGNHFVIEGGWFSSPFAYDTISGNWTKLKTDSLINNNDSACAVVGTSAYYFGGYFNQYQNHMAKLDLENLSFLLTAQ